MAAMGAKLQGDAQSQFLFEGDASGKHEGIVQGVNDQGWRGDGGQVAAATGPVVIVEAAQGGGNPLVEGVAIPGRVDIGRDGVGAWWRTCLGKSA